MSVSSRGRNVLSNVTLGRILRLKLKLERHNTGLHKTGGARQPFSGFSYSSWPAERKHIIILVSQSPPPPCRIKRQEYYPETERVCGARPGGWLPQLVLDP